VLFARVGSARVRLQIDVGFGDAITPSPSEVDFPTLLDFPAPHVRAYPRETVVSEKLEAMVQLSITNSRMKDFYDIAFRLPLRRHLLQSAPNRLPPRQTPLRLRCRGAPWTEVPERTS
jgi:hypothetical protein